MANTVIQLKYSGVTNKPPLLNVAEPAYSSVSGTLWINDGTDVVAIGGKAYTDKIDAATSTNTGNTLILRDVDGNFSSNVVSANVVVLGTGAGGDITGANTISANYFFGSLSTPTGVTEGTYGSTTSVPIITVSANGLVTNVTTTSFSSSLGIAGDSGTDSIALGTDTLTFVGGDGIVTAVDSEGNNVTFSVDETVVRTSGNQTIDGDLSVGGNLVVLGTTTYVNTAINQTYDSMIELAANNTVGDILDIGFYGKHEGADGTVVTGLVRNAGTSDFYLFDNIALGDQTDISANIITQAAMSANGASLYAKQFMASDVGLTGGYAFNTGTPTGMFSEADGRLQFFVNGAIAGEINSNTGNTAIGLYAAESGQGYRAVAIGYGAGQTTQSSYASAIGLHAGQTLQGTAAVALGHSAGQFNQGQDTVAIGSHAGQNTQSYQATAVGYRAGYGNITAQGQYSLALGAFAGVDSQVDNSIALNASGSALNPTEAGFYVDPIRANNAIGGNVAVYNTATKEVVSTDIRINDSGITLANGTVISDNESGFFVDALNANTTSNVVFYNSTTKEITYGVFDSSHIANGSFSWTVDGTTGALYSTNGTHIGDSGNSVVIGQNVDLTNSNTNRVAIGNGAGQTTQGYGSTAVGEGAGANNQSYMSVAIGLNAGNDNQQHSSVAVGHTAGRIYQGADSVAVGVAAGQNTQGAYAVAIGERAGYGSVTAQGDYSIAIGSKAGYSNAFAGSIIFNASGSQLNSTQAGLYINPVRYVETQDATYDGISFYNSDTKEMTYSYVLSGGSF